MAGYCKTETGLSTLEALKILHLEIENELHSCSCKCHGKSGFIIWLKESFHHSSVSSTFQWPSILLTLLVFIIFIFSYISSKDITLFFQSMFILFSLIFNIIITGLETRFRHIELHKKCGLLAKQIKLCLDSCKIIEYWKTGKYHPNLYLPQSPCISLQWTYRDSRRVNLPSVLLAKGDVISLCPGHPAPGHCSNIKSPECVGSNGSIELQAGDIFSPLFENESITFATPKLRKTAKPAKFVMLETPFIANLKQVLERSWKRPATLYEKERHIILTKYSELIVIPIIWVINLLACILLYKYFETNINFKLWSNSFYFIFLRPSLCLLPLLPLTLPSTWLFVNIYGAAHLLNLIKSCPMLSDSLNTTNLNLNSPGSAISAFNIKSKKCFKENFFDDFETNSSGDVVSPFSMSWQEMFKSIFNLFFCKDGNLWRSARFLQVFGSITAFCCVDKKGILSWPNPAADKVFFLNSNREKSSHLSNYNHNFHISPTIESLANNELSNKNVKNNDYYNKRGTKVKKTKYCSKAEVLDITHDVRSSFGLQFDDPEWRRFLPNLKPLGLGILLNTCNVKAEEEYFTFCNHITCESLRNVASVPVVNKRCLCELSRIMGFTERAIDNYDYMFQVSSFRHVKPEIIQEGKLAKSLNLPRLKMPFPNMSSALIKDICTGSYQMFSQGTGDLILDTCTEFWDGQDLCVLTEIDRKRILDFYQRSSLTANCMAFAYIPINIMPDSQLINNYFIELPPEGNYLFRSSKSLISYTKSSDNRDLISGSELSHHFSLDLLLMGSVSDEKNLSKSKTKNDSLNSFVEAHQFESLFNQLNNEVFIGMVTMQYQACPDFVTLIEQLDKACVRFVHFSKENELRSRVFSQKMGLESGWNCHISLLSEISCSDQTQNQHFLYANSSRGSKSSLLFESNQISGLTRTHSAPSYVNMETSVVKFERKEFVVGLNEDHQEISSEIQDKMSVGNASDESGKDNCQLVESNEDLSRSKIFSNISPSPSRITESTNTEHSVPFTFDISNRAKLPKGIENIRPHLKSVDNVPLLVSLFTDCTPETTREMIEIMQENGEVVCVIGSSANFSNTPIFLQADTSIGIEPLYPQICINEPITEALSKPFKGFVSPTDISNLLNTLPCSLTFHREDSLNLNRIIMEARHFMMNARNHLQFFFSCSLSLSLAQLFASLLFLPPLLSSGQVLWLVCVIFPILSLSLMGTSLEPQVMNMATGKNLNLNKETVIYFLLCYIIKFIPSIIITVACFALIINNSCKYIHGPHFSSPCWMYINENLIKNESDYESVKIEIWFNHLLISQTFSAFFLVLYFIVISFGFVHRFHLLWQRSPFSNTCWVMISVVLFSVHSLFCIIEVIIYQNESNFKDSYFKLIPFYVYLISFLWPLIIILINGLIKMHEVKIFQRQQRRARLEFGTKLGMNSPF